LGGRRDLYGHNIADGVASGGYMNALEIGTAPDKLTRMTAWLFEQNWKDAADAGLIERTLLPRQQFL
jgi:hypothetical protein